MTHEVVQLCTCRLGAGWRFPMGCPIHDPQPVATTTITACLRCVMKDEVIADLRLEAQGLAESATEWQRLHVESQQEIGRLKEALQRRVNDCDKGWAGISSDVCQQCVEDVTLIGNLSGATLKGDKAMGASG